MTRSERSSRGRWLALGVALVGVGIASSVEWSGPDTPAVDAQTPVQWLALDGVPAFVVGQNPYGRDPQGYERFFDASAAAGERFARLHLRYGLAPAEAAAGEVDLAWAARWEGVFQAAASRGIHVLPSFGSWDAWADESSGSFWQRWRQNPYNTQNGGPAESPSDLLAEGETRRLFVAWIATLVARFAHHDNIAGWEIFSEIDLVSGADDSGAVLDFVGRAAEAIRKADSKRRPVTVAVSGAEAIRSVGTWDALWASDAVDWVQVHPYPGPWGEHDLMRSLAALATRMARFGKPILVGESGLAALPEEEDGPVAWPRAERLPRSPIGYRQAAWTALLSGYAVGGMFWWMSGYPEIEDPLRYPDLSRPVARLATQLEGERWHRVPLETDASIFGVALSNGARTIGYVRDERCVYPNWPGAALAGQSVRVFTPAPTGARARFLSPVDLEVTGQANVERAGSVVTLPLPEFREDLLFIIEAGSTPQNR